MDVFNKDDLSSYEFLNELLEIGKCKCLFKNFDNHLSKMYSNKFNNPHQHVRFMNFN